MGVLAGLWGRGGDYILLLLWHVMLCACTRAHLMHMFQQCYRKGWTLPDPPHLVTKVRLFEGELEGGVHWEGVMMLTRKRGEKVGERPNA